MIGSTLAPCPLFDPSEMTGDLRDDWDLPEGNLLFDEHSKAWKKYRLTQASATFHQLLHQCSGAAVTLPKIDNRGSRS